MGNYLSSKMYQATNFLIVAAAGAKMPVYHLVEYPKCGGSWIRNMMQDYLGGKVYLGDRLVSRDTVIQVHRLYGPVYCNPVIVFRDPRDVYVSFYYHEKRLLGQGGRLEIGKYFRHDPDRSLSEDFEAYLGAKLGNRTDPGFSYREFVSSWLDRPGICRVHYEEFLLYPERELTKIVEFMGKLVNRESISEIVSYHSFENETRRRYGHARKPGTEDTAKFQRKGVSGDWKKHFNRSSCEMIQESEWDSLYGLGYESDRDWIERFISQESVPD